MMSRIYADRCFSQPVKRGMRLIMGRSFLRLAIKFLGFRFRVRPRNILSHQLRFFCLSLRALIISVKGYLASLSLHVMEIFERLHEELRNGANLRALLRGLGHQLADEPVDRDGELWAQLTNRRRRFGQM